MNGNGSNDGLAPERDELPGNGSVVNEFVFSTLATSEYPPGRADIDVKQCRVSRENARLISAIEDKRTSTSTDAP